jgi:hypothetical protein
MATIHNVVPPQMSVTIPYEGGDVEVDVRGLTIQDVSDLLMRFPDLVGAFDGKMDVGSMMKWGPQVLAAIMAYACGAANDRKVEDSLLSMPLTSQVEILTIVVRLTAPKGVGPFVALVKALGLDVSKLQSTAASAVTSASVSGAPSPTSNDGATPSIN